VVERTQNRPAHDCRQPMEEEPRTLSCGTRGLRSPVCRDTEWQGRRATILGHRLDTWDMTPQQFPQSFDALLGGQRLQANGMSGTALFFHALAPVLTANILTATWLYAFTRARGARSRSMVGSAV